MSGVRNEDFEKLALPLLDSLYNFARWMSGNPDEAQDLVQETFLKALRGFGGFQESTNFRAWIFRILRNTFLTSRTGLERRSTTQEDEEGFENVVPIHETPESMLMRRADTELVQEAIAKLSSNYQEVVLLVDIEEMKYQEVADTLGVPIGTVMSRLARARKQIREFITEAMETKKTVGAKS